MYLCRLTLQRVAPLIRGSSFRLATLAPVRQMSSGSVPGSSGNNWMYFAVVGASLTAGAVYAYRTITSDKSRFQDRVGVLGATSKNEWVPKPWPPPSKNDEEVASTQDLETSEELTNAETGEVEAASISAAEQEEQAAIAVEPERAAPQAEEESLSMVEEGAHEGHTSSETATAEG